MIINMSGGGGGGSSATLVVSGVAGSTVTATKGDKTYTRTLNNEGKATFKGLASGTWTITMTDGTQTATRTVTITADYDLTIAYFSATISITYPAASTCVVTDSAGTQIASDTNGDSSAKTWTATVGATGTYTITATSADGAKTKSTSVAITTDGQSESTTLTYELALYTNGTFDTTITREELITNGKIEYGESTINCTISYNAPAYSMIAFKGIDLTQFSTISLQIDSLGYWKDGTTIAVVPNVGNWNPKSPTKGTVAYTWASVSTETVSELTVDVSAINGPYDVVVGLNTQGGTWGSGRSASYSEVLIK